VTGCYWRPRPEGFTVKAKLHTSLNHNVVATQYGWWQECQELAAPGYDSEVSKGHRTAVASVRAGQHHAFLE
jgi:hypothetical protein